jgi:hypothetical protein
MTVSHDEQLLSKPFTGSVLRAADGCLHGEDLIVPRERGGLYMCRLRE